jgi:cytochrome c biogenesis protein
MASTSGQILAIEDRINLALLLWRFFSSIKLTLTLLLGMAVVAIPGTVIRPEMGRYEVFYQTPWFRALLFLLALNLLVCTIRTIGRNLRDRQRFDDQLSRLPASAIRLANPSLDNLQLTLNSLGFRGDQTGNRIWGRRGRIGRWGSTLVHCSLLAIMCGAILGESGFVGTVNTYLHDENHFYFDWDTQQDKALGFALRVDRFELLYYPITLRFDLVDPAEGRKIGTFTQLEGESIELAAGRTRVLIKGFNPDEKVLTLGVFRQGNFLGDYLVSEKGESFGALGNPGFQVKNIQFRDPLLKQMESDVVILENNLIVKRGTISVNQPLTWRGVTIYQTAYGKDEAGRRTTGFQLSKDPGEMIVWIASVLLILGLGAAFIIPYRALGVRRFEDSFYLMPLHGFRGEAGAEQLAKIAQNLDSPDKSLPSE